MVATVNILQKYIEEIAQVLREQSLLINMHMVDYFTKNGYVTCIPLGIREEIEKIGFKSIIEKLFLNNINEDTPNLKDFIKTTQNFSLYNKKDVCLDTTGLQQRLVDLGCKNVEGIQLKVFMKPKKCHEVEVLSAIIASLGTIGDISHVIDIGDGKGYLSSLLSLHYKIPVLGIDASEINTTGAVKRIEKLEKVWPSVLKTNKSLLPKKDLKYSTNLLYKQITKFVTEETDFKQLISDIFIKNISNLSIVGLHTCGDLAPSTFKIFTNNPEIKSLCNVSCCYHMMTENDTNPNYGFPMSKFLINKNYNLGRIARMLSSQSIDRILAKKELPNKTIFYRAILEVILNKYHPNLQFNPVGKLRRPNITFNEYIRKALRKLNVSLDLNDEEIEEFHRIFVHREDELYTFNLLRCMLAPLIESIILLDRLLYLYECGYENSYLVQLFDPVISPRCYGIISYKK